MSSRHLTDEQFWFTLFHEAGHLLLHEQRTLFSGDEWNTSAWIVEGLDDTMGSREEEANNFAAGTLVPDSFRQQLLTLRTETKPVIRFASRLGVSPGIVVGQLQHLGRIGFHQMNYLKRRFKWEESTLVTRERM